MRQDRSAESPHNSETQKWTKRDAMVKVILKPLDDGVTGDIELPAGKTTLGRGAFLNVSAIVCDAC